MFHSLYFVRNDLISFSDYLKLMYPKKWIAPPTGISSWQTDTAYTTGNLVKRSSRLYRCVTDHTSGSSFDSSKWVDIYRIKVGDVVRYGSGLYVCETAHTSGSSFDADYKAGYFNLVSLSGEEKGFWNTWRDWHLIPSSRPAFASPKMRQRTIEIPGADGVLDLSDAFTGGPIYENAEGSFEFIVDNDWESWETIYQKILNEIHGYSLQSVLEDDPSFYREGRISVNQWKSEPKNSKIVLDYSVKPYKQSINSSDKDAYWDPIVFETDIIRDYKGIEIVSVTENNKTSYKVQYTRTYDCSTFTRDYLDFYCGRQSATVRIRCTESTNLAIAIKNVTKNLAGAYVEPEDTIYSQTLAAGSTYNVALRYGHYRFRFTGIGKIDIIYREGSL